MPDSGDLDRILERFHDALARGERPELGALLPADGPATPVLIELVHAELEYRWKHGEAVPVEEYLRRYPQLEREPAAVAELVLAEYHLRRRLASGAALEEYLQRFPALAALLQRRLSTPARLPPGEGSGSAAGSGPPALPGYEILGELGRGGMGIVYKARQKGLDRLVALKVVLTGGQTGSEQLLRFRIEGEAVARLRHPNIVQLYEVGEHQGLAFLALEFIDGTTLERHTAGRPQAPRAAGGLVATLARAIHHAHLQGLIHRDLKPQNVLVARDGTLRITDFGLVKRRNGEGALTATGQVLGTPGYMAPEQAAGDSAAVGPATDVWALGAILYKLLTGRAPCHETNLYAAVRQVLAEDEPSLPRGAPRDLVVICRKCLHREPARRYGSALELADDLERWLRGEPIQARPTPLPERALKWVRRRPAAALAWLTLAGALAAGVAGLLWHNAGLREQTERADDQRRRAEANAALARDRLYVADMARAQQLLQAGNVLALHELLQRHRPLPGEPERRGFEWHYLARHAQPRRPVLWAGPLGGPYLLACTADGRLLLAVSLWLYDGGRRLWVWDATGRLVRSVPIPCRSYTTALALSADGRFLAAGADERTVVVYDVARSVERARRTFPGTIDGLAFTPDGHRLTVHGYGPLCQWDWLRNQAPVDPPRPPPALPLLSAPHRLLPLLDSRGSLVLWDFAAGRARHRLAIQEKLTALVSFPRRGWLAAAQASAPILVWNEHGQRIAALTGHAGQVQALAVSPDERTLAATGDDGTVRFYELPSGRLYGTLRCQSTANQALAWCPRPAPGGPDIAVRTEDGLVFLLRAPVRAGAADRLHPSANATGPVTFSPDGRTLAVAGADGRVSLFDVARGRPPRTLPDSAPLADLAFAPDGRTVVTVNAADPTVRLWDVASGRLERWLLEPGGRIVRRLAFGRGSWLLGAGEFPQVVVWDALTGRVRGRWAGGHKDAILALAVAPNGQLLATADHSGGLRVWDVRRWSAAPAGADLPAPVLLTSRELGTPIVRLAWTPDGRRVGAAVFENVYWQDVGVPADSVRSPARPLPGSWWKARAPAHASAAAFHFSADGHTLLTGDSSWVQLWDGATRERRHTLNEPNHFVAAALSPDGRRLATVGSDRALQLWDTNAWRASYPLGRPLRPVCALAFSDGGRTLLTGGSAPRQNIRCIRQLPLLGREVCLDTLALSRASAGLHRWDVPTGREQPPLPGPLTMAAPARLAVSPDGGRLVGGGADGSLWIWDLRSARLVCRRFVSTTAQDYALLTEGLRRLGPFHPAYREEVRDLTFSPDGRTLAVLSRTGRVALWDAHAWRERERLPGAQPERRWVRFAPDGRTLAVSVAGAVQLWDVPGLRLRATLGAEGDAPSLCGTFAPDRSVLVSGTRDGAVRVWDCASNTVQAVATGHLDALTAVAFAPDGRTLASASADRTVRLWNVATWQETLVLEGHRGKVLSVCFSPEGGVLASGGQVDAYTGEVLLWRGGERLEGQTP
jgi:WD40 repeat protein